MTAAFERQTRAADPGTSTWLAANAGSGKTRVLTDRVARLLLGGVDPQRILCLTYTKAAAAEMQNRLFRRLGDWVLRPADALAAELAALGEPGPIGAAALARARRLFARAIETPGGLRIQTIHSFCAGVLRRFPLEAGVSPAFAEMEDRAATLLRDEIVEEMAGGPAAQVVADLAALWTGEDFTTLTAQIARERGRLSPPLDPAGARRLFSLPAGLDAAALRAEVFLGGEGEWLPRVAARMAAGDKPTDTKAAAVLAAIDPATTPLSVLEDLFLYGAGTARPHGAKTDRLPTKGMQAALGPLLPPLQALMQRVEAVRPRRLALLAAERTAVLHAFAAEFLPRYAARKAERGLLDFDDLIERTLALLTTSEMAAWVLYRLDGGIDHILVDEAQDTSPAQWQIIERLAEEFTSQQGARPRTIFVVGDKKQSIYSFQGADVAAFDRMRDQFAGRLGAIGAPFQSESLLHSFRSSPAVLNLVDAVFADAPAEAVGEGVRHQAYRDTLPGRVDLWPPLVADATPAEDDWTDPVDHLGAEHPDARLARQIAAEIAAMVAAGTAIPVPGGGVRPLQAGDVLILVQRRATLFAEIIRACKAAGLPVAGADRLKLGAEMAVRDLVALLSFLALPDDDLSLAAALKSPLFGWDEDALFRLAHGRPGGLWQALRGRAEPQDPTLAVLHDLGAQADFLRPFDLIERILVRHDGRRRLVARLGPEAEDGIDELLSQALAYERGEVPTLSGFLVWLSADEVEVRRQTEAGGNRIRVMTVHGAKGLEAPVVILPDTADRDLRDTDRLVPLGHSAVWGAARDEAPPPLAAEIAARAARREAESLRLLYVALTRAQVWLIVAAAGKTEKDGCWFNRVARGFDRLAAEAGPGGRRRIAYGDWPAPMALPPPPPALPAVPDWVGHPAPAAAPAPRPVAPTALGGAKVLPGDGAEASPDEAEAAMARGHLLHLLLEHLPGTAPATWPALAAALIPDAAQRAELLAEAAGVLGDPGLAPLFAAGALSEVTVTGTWQGRALEGVIDRLIPGPEVVLAVDYKSNRLIPDDPAAVPEGYLRQMGAYAHLLAQVYPGRRIETAILWTRAPRLMRLSPDRVIAALGRATLP